MATRTVPYITPEEYLEAERKAEYKSHYYDGRVYPRSSATRRQSLIAGNLLVALSDSRWETHGSLMRLSTPSRSLYTYPDVSVVCGTPRFEGRDEDVLLNPTAILEVLPLTSAHFSLYQTIESLQEYLVVSEHERRVEICRRLNDKDWRIETIDSTSGRVRLASVDVELSFDQIYAGVTPEA